MPLSGSGKVCAAGAGVHTNLPVLTGHPFFAITLGCERINEDEMAWEMATPC